MPGTLSRQDAEIDPVEWIVYHYCRTTAGILMAASPTSISPSYTDCLRLRFSIT